MKTPKRILVAHADAHTRRMLTMLLVETGLSVQAVEPENEAVAALRGERFDLALIGHITPDDQIFALSEPLREEQPDLPIVMLLPELKLPLVVQGIRHGLTDVLPLRSDPKPVLRRIMSLVGLDAEVEPTAAELAEVEATLAQLDPSVAVPAVDKETGEQRDRLWKGLRELHFERELIAAAQAGIDEKARILREDRAELHREREEFASEVIELRQEGEEIDQEWVGLDQEKKSLQTERSKLEIFENELREREAASAMAMTTPPMRVQPVGGQHELAQAWEEVERAQQSLEAERAVFRDERMLLTDLDRQIRKREERLRDLTEQIQDVDRRRRGLPPPPPKAFSKPVLATGAVRKRSLFKSLLGGRT